MTLRKSLETQSFAPLESNLAPSQQGGSLTTPSHSGTHVGPEGGTWAAAQRGMQAIGTTSSWPLALPCYREEKNTTPEPRAVRAETGYPGWRGRTFFCNRSPGPLLDAPSNVSQGFLVESEDNRVTVMSPGEQAPPL